MKKYLQFIKESKYEKGQWVLIDLKNVKDKDEILMKKHGEESDPTFFRKEYIYAQIFLYMDRDYAPYRIKWWNGAIFDVDEEDIIRPLTDDEIKKALEGPERIYSEEDPYGEEVWNFFESINSDIDPYHEEDWGDYPVIFRNGDSLECIIPIKNIEIGDKGYVQSAIQDVVHGRSYILNFFESRKNVLLLSADVAHTHFKKIDNIEESVRWFKGGKLMPPTNAEGTFQEDEVFSLKKGDIIKMDNVETWYPNDNEFRKYQGTDREDFHRVEMVKHSSEAETMEYGVGISKYYHGYVFTVEGKWPWYKFIDL